MVPYGVVGTLFARGTINSAALIALVEGGVFTELPGLRVEVTGHAIGGLAMAADLSKQCRQPGGAVEVLRKHVLIDTQMIHSTLIRTAVELLGAENVPAAVTGPSSTRALSNCR
jgi:aminocarboxymuconate-semialdehyde decarboxylase